METSIVQCPTCGMSGAAPCVRGRKWSPIWERKEAMPAPHDSRITAQQRSASANFKLE